MTTLPPIDVVDRFPRLRDRLLEVLTTLSEQDWSRRTAARLWSVKDIALHLLGGDISILSRKRDSFSSSTRSIDSYEDLVEFLNDWNAQWVAATRRLSPRVLCDFLSFTGPQVEAYFASLDLHAMGDPVSWAGPERAPVWLDVAREFTERWHHQQQIRDATGAPPLYEPYFFKPVLDAFIHALPHAFRHRSATENTVVKVGITGEAGNVWFLRRVDGEWRLSQTTDTAPAAEVSIPQDTAWKLFTKGVDREQARSRAAMGGDSSLIAPFFETVAVIA